MREGCFEGVKAMGIIVTREQGPPPKAQAGTGEGSHASTAHFGESRRVTVQPQRGPYVEVYNAPRREVMREGCFEGVKAMGIIVTREQGPPPNAQAGTGEGSHASTAHFGESRRVTCMPEERAWRAEKSRVGRVEAKGKSARLVRLGNFECDGAGDEALNRAIGSARYKLNRFCGG